MLTPNKTEEHEKKRLFIQNPTPTEGKKMTKSNGTRPQKTYHLESVLQALKESGFYWSDITSNEAKDLLKDKTPGTFLVRQSSDQRHLFSITLKTVLLVTSIRVAMFNGIFQLDSAGERSVPAFDCVVKLVCYYMAASKRTQESSQQEIQRRKSKLLLTKPLYKEVRSLKHLSRTVVNRHLQPEGGHALPLPANLKLYLRRYPHPIWRKEDPKINPQKPETTYLL